MHLRFPLLAAVFHLESDSKLLNGNPYVYTLLGVQSIFLELSLLEFLKLNFLGTKIAMHFKSHQILGIL